MKVFVILLILIGFTCIAFAESNTGGSVLAITTPFSSYVSGDKVFVRGDANPNSNVTINVISPSLDAVRHFSILSDEDGRIFTSFFLPVDSEIGTWIMNATYGVNFDTAEFEVVRLQKDRMIQDITSLEIYRPISDPFYYSDHVLVGTILQKENASKTILRYSIDVDFYLKNEQSFDFITAILDDVEKPNHDNPVVNMVLSSNRPDFDEGDVVFIYLKNINGQYKILPDSFLIEKSGRYLPTGIVHTSPVDDVYYGKDKILFSGMVQKAELYQAAKKDKPFHIILTIRDDADYEIISESLNLKSNATYEYELSTKDLPAGKYKYEIDFRGGSSGSLFAREIIINSNQEYVKPLKQFQSGIPFNEIQCKDNLILVQKHDGSPACVKPNSIIDLIKRNWVTTDNIEGYAIDYDGDVQHLPFADICTNEMKMILLTHSNIASPDEKFVIDDVELPPEMSQENFQRCADATSFTKSRWNMVDHEQS